jgi:GT2 family glycosyltransferase
MTPSITYILTPICEVFIARFLFTLYKYSEPGTFNVIVVDQTKDQFSKPLMDYIKPMVHLYLHPRRNLGYAKAMNEGIVHALHWGTPLICLANDDVEIMDKRWIDGIWKTFEKNERIIGVVPMSPRVAGWGYGVSYNPEILPYKTEYTKEDYDYLLAGDFTDNPMELPKTYPRKVTGTIVDGAVFVMPYFKREMFEKVGLLDEHYFPGSGEDMDLCARVYQQNMRIVSTSLSWIWHHWTKSKDLFASGQLEDPYYKPLDHPYWNDESKIWPHGFDVWGKDKDGKPFPRVAEIFVDEI